MPRSTAQGDGLVFRLSSIAWVEELSRFAPGGVGPYNIIHIFVDGQFAQKMHTASNPKYERTCCQFVWDTLTRMTQNKHMFDVCCHPPLGLVAEMYLYVLCLKNMCNTNYSNTHV